MNSEARNILVERAISNIPIAYSTFMQQLGFDSIDSSVLYSTLEEISRFEKENGRPALTVMAKYLDRDEWGPAFYKLTEELGYLKPGEKPDKFFAKRMQKECHEYWLNAKKKSDYS